MARIASKQLIDPVGVPVMETPTGSVNGSNVDFYLSYTPISNTLVLFLNSAEEYAYTISGNHITMTTAPALAQELKAFYRRLPA